MKKKITSQSALKPTKAVIPLAVALSMIYAGTAFGAEKTFEVQMNDGKIARFNAAQMTNAAYAAQVKAALENAFNNGKRLYIEDDTKGWIDFGAKAHDMTTYDAMLSNPTAYTAIPAADNYDLYFVDSSGAVTSSHY